MSDATSSCTRCTGHCCRAFRLGNGNFDFLQRNPGNVQDGEQLLAMLVALPPGSPAVPANAPRGNDLENPWLTCRNHDAETGDCRVYDTRPRMCREYPYGRVCEYSACTMVPEQPRKAEEADIVVALVDR